MADANEHHRTSVMTMIMIAAIAVLFMLFLLMLILYIIESTSDENIVDATFVYAEDGAAWGEDEELQVFYNQEFGNNTVSPYSSGTFVFLFENQSDYTLKYQIDLGENNEYDIALCYRLKRDGAYLIEDYTRTADFDCSGITIEAHSTHSFELEWYWDGDISDVNDTLAGNTQCIYTLTITLSAASA